MKMRNLFQKFCSLALIALLTLGITVLGVGAREVEDVVKESEYVGRVFNDKYDRLYDNFQRKQVDAPAQGSVIEQITLSGDVSFDENAPYFRATYSSSQSNTADEAIIKGAAAGNGDSIAFPYLVLTLRGSEGASISDLVLGFRRDDSHQILEVPFNEVVMSDGDYAMEFDGTFQTYVVALNDTLDGKEYLPNGEGAPVAADRLVGFHLYSKTETGSGVVDTKFGYYSKFADVSDVTPGGVDYPILAGSGDGGDGYWGGSTGPRVDHWLLISGAASYLSYGSEAFNHDQAYENFVITIRGDADTTLDDISVVPYNGDADATPVKMSELKGPNEELLPALKTSFTSYVISFEHNTWAKEATGLKIVSTAGSFQLRNIFLTNMEVAPVADAYPTLDASSIVLFDNFNREVSGQTHEYDANNPVAINYGFSYIIDYSKSNALQIKDGALALNQGGGSYVQYSVRSEFRYSNNSHEYVVFKLKPSEGADINNFRFAIKTSDDGSSTPIVFLNQLFAAPGLPSIPADLDSYEYKLEDGYAYYIVDLALNNLGSEVYGFDLYFGGTGELLVDSIFMANSYKLTNQPGGIFLIDDYNRDELTQAPDSLHWVSPEAGQVSIVDGSLKLDGTNEFSQIAMGIKFKNARYLQFDLKVEEGSDLSTFRFGLPFADKWVKDSVVIDRLGKPITSATTEWQTYVVDLVASGMDLGDTLRFAIDGGNIVYLDNLVFIQEERVFFDSYKLVDDFNRAELNPNPDTVYWNNFEGGEGLGSIVDGAMKLDGSGFIQYAVGFPQSNYRYLQLKVKGEAADAFSNLRIKFGDNPELWFNSGKYVDHLGNLVEHPQTEEFTTIIIDVLKTFGYLGGDTIRIATDGGHTLLIDEIGVLYGAYPSVNALETVANGSFDGLLNKGIDTVFVGDNWVDAGINVSESTLVEVFGTVDTSTAGRYVVTYLVAKEVLVQRVVNVLEAPEQLAQVIFTLNAGVDQIKVGDTWTDGGAIAKLGDVSQTVTVDSSAVDTSVAGQYKVIYSVVIDEVIYTTTRVVFVTE